MHTSIYRANALFTAAATALAVMAALAALTDVGLPAAPGPIAARVAAVEGLQRDRTHDRAHLLLDVSADLRPLWHWNVKQAFVYVAAELGPTPADSDTPGAATGGGGGTLKKNGPAAAGATHAILWSRIVRSKAEAAIVRTGLRAEFPYTLTGRGHGLRGAPVNLTVGWALTPRVGALRGGVGSGAGSVGVGVLPDTYVDPAAPVGDWE